MLFFFESLPPSSSSESDVTTGAFLAVVGISFLLSSSASESTSELDSSGRIFFTSARDSFLPPLPPCSSRCSPSASGVRRRF